MVERYSYKAGLTVDGWDLIEPLGSGGNAEVWSAKRNGGQPVALKILRQRNPAAEPYKRFAAEIRVLTALGSVPGVLPLIAASLPPSPSRTNPAWLATPIATPILLALTEEQRLRSAVQALSAIASTLAMLATEHQLHHRDLKPENLYLFDGNWCVGDFGLVKNPDNDALTGPGALLGPRHYLAPELLTRRPVDFGPVDVYALLKTLWVLATGQAYPPPGFLAPNIAQLRLASYVFDDNVRPLELLIGRGTDTDPARRPTMAEVATELRAWLNPQPFSRATPSLDELRLRVRPIVEMHVAAEDESKHRQQHVIEVLERIRIELEKMGSDVETVTGLIPEYGAWSDFEECGAIQNLREHPEVTYVHWIALHVVAPSVHGTDVSKVQLLSGFVMGITSTDQVFIAAIHMVRMAMNAFQIPWSRDAVAYRGSAMESDCVNELIGELHSQLGPALVVFADALEGHVHPEFARGIL